MSDTCNTLAVDGETRVTTSGGVFSYTDEQVKENVDEYKSKASSLQMVHTTVPLVGVVLGLLLILGGVLLARRNQQRGPGPRAARRVDTAPDRRLTAERPWPSARGVLRCVRAALRPRRTRPRGRRW